MDQKRKYLDNKEDVDKKSGNANFLMTKNTSAPILSYLNEYLSSESEIDEERDVKSKKKGILVKKSRWETDDRRKGNEHIHGTHGSNSSFVKRDFKYEHVTIISDDRYLPFLKHLKKSGVSVIPYPNLKMEEFEEYLLKKNEHSSKSTLFLLVIGIHSVTKTVQANFCYASGCKNPLQALNSINNFEKFNIKYVQMLQSLIKSCKISLPSKSNIAILPALPISLHSNYGSHQVLHLKQTQFPHYVFENKGNSISKWYSTWMDSVAKISHLSFLEYGEGILAMFDKFNDEHYKNVKLMTCKRGLDKPTYNIWKKVVEDVVDLALKDSVSRSISNDRNLIENVAGTSNASKHNNSKTIDNEMGNIQFLDLQENFKNMVLCDHLVFIGHADSLDLLPDIGFCSYSQWHFDDIIESTNLSIKISTLSNKDFKKVLFIIISDVSMIGNEEKNSECILKNCKELISYVKSPNAYVSMLGNLKKNLNYVKEAILDIKKLCTFQSKVIIAPFTPRVYIMISSIIFHTKMHANKKDTISTRFLRGSTKKIWDDILKKFEEEWNKLALELLQESTDKLLHVKNIILSYTETVKCPITWKELTVDIPEADYSAILSWKSCIIVLAMKAWGQLSDSSLHMDKDKENIQTSSILPLHQQKEQLLPLDLKMKDVDSKANEIDNKGSVEIDRSNRYREIDEILNFANNIVNCHKTSNFKKHEKIMFNHVFIVGSSELISPLQECNISSTMIYHNFVNFENEEIQHLLYQMGSSQGNVCCLVFDISIITTKSMSPGCLQHSCQQPLYVTALNMDYSQAINELELLISTQLQSISNFIRKLSEYIPVLILPLSPVRLYCDDEESQYWHHQISHSINNFRSQVVFGSIALWNRAVQLLVYSWNNLMNFVNCNYDSNNYISSYISSSPSTFITHSKAIDFTINWIEPEIWKAFTEIFLQSLVAMNVLDSNSEMMRSITCSDKICVTVTQLSPSVPANFFKEFFYMADENVLINSENDKYIVKGISLGRANLLAKKLNEYKVGIATLLASSNIGNDYFEFCQMEKLCILAKLEKVYNKWKPEIIKNIAQKINEDPNILSLKSMPCKKKDCQQAKSCIFYHSPQDKRRNPLNYKYSYVPCEVKKKSGCFDGLQCEYSHNLFESKFHPLLYQLKPCLNSSVKSAGECNANELCNLAHEDSPEMFFTSCWKDLMVIGHQGSLRFFTGAIKAATKVEEVRRSNLKVFLMSPSSEFLDITMKASSELIKSFGLIIGGVTGSNLSSPDSFQVFAGNPIAFVNFNLDLFSELVGCIIVDDVQKILENDFLLHCMLQFFQMVGQFSSSVLNKVFISPSDSFLIRNNNQNFIAEAVGTELKVIRSSDSDYSYQKLPDEGLPLEGSTLLISPVNLPKCPSPPPINLEPPIDLIVEPDLKQNRTADLTSTDCKGQLVIYSDDEDKGDHKTKKRSSDKVSKNSSLKSKSRRSHSRSVERRGSRRSRSRSYSHSRSSQRRRSLSRTRDRKKKKRERDNYSSERANKEKESEKEQILERNGLPPIKENHLSVFSTTLCATISTSVRNKLHKKVSSRELTAIFEPFGTIISLDIIHRTVTICMKRRHDAARALKKLHNYKLKMDRYMDVVWMPDIRVAKKFFRDYWSVKEGCSYIPYDDLCDISDSHLDAIQKIGLIDEESLPSFLKGIGSGQLYSSLLKNIKQYDHERKESKKKATMKKRETSSSDEDSDSDFTTKTEVGKSKLREIESIPIVETLPSLDNHLCISSTTLWVGHLPKLFDQNELTDSFKEYGDIVSVNHIPPKRCALICMSRRKDAATALKKLINLKLQKQHVSIAWAPGDGVKRVDFKKYWDEKLGCSYIPYDVLLTMKPSSLSSLEDGGEVIGEMPSFNSLKAKDSSKNKEQTDFSTEDSILLKKKLKLVSDDVSTKSWTLPIPNTATQGHLESSKLVDRLESEDDYLRRRKTESNKSHQQEVSYSSEKPSIAHPLTYPGLDTQTDLCTRLGKKLYEEYNVELEKKRHSFENDFMVYYNVPELYPNYQIHFESFTSMYMVQHKGKTAQHKERLWKLYWKSVFEDIKNEEWEKCEKILIEEMEKKVYNPVTPVQSSSLAKEEIELHQMYSNIPMPMSINSNSFPHSEIDLPLDATPHYSAPSDVQQERFSSYSERAGSSSHRRNEEFEISPPIPSKHPIVEANIHPHGGDSIPYSFGEAISLIDRLSEDIGFLGPSVKAMVDSSKELGITTEQVYMSFTESENVMLLKMMLEKVKLLCISGPSSNLHLYNRAVDWIPKFLEDAKKGPPPQTLPKIDDLKIDLEALGRGSLGKEPKYVLQLIRTALSFEGIQNPPKEYVNALFLKICAVHFALSMED